MKLVLILLAVAVSACAGCITVSSDRIVAGDLREAVPILETLDPQTPIGFTPLPGTQRTLSSRELTLIAQRHGLATPGLVISSVCVERSVRPISREEMHDALIAGLGMPDAELELLEFSNQPAPRGRLEFQRATLTKPPAEATDAPVTWRGKLVYDGGRSVMVWAKVRITVDRAVLEASEDIAVGSIIRANQIKEVHHRRFPVPAASTSIQDAIIGKVARRNIPAGSEFIASALGEVKDINQGEKVQVNVIDGLASLSLEAIAESSGRKGESILVHNPSTGKNFRAIVEDRGKVVVKSSPGV